MPPGQASTSFTFNLSLNASARIGAASLNVTGLMAPPDCQPLVGITSPNTSDGLGWGWAVAALGDVNGDQIDDFAVGGHGQSNGPDGRGRVGVYYGRASGTWPDEPDWSYWGPYGLAFGTGIVVGEYTGDTYPDLVVSEFNLQFWDNNSIFLFAGSASGFASTPTAELFPPSIPSPSWGKSIAGGLDVDGDGYHDLLVGEDYYVGSVGQGRVSVLWGGPTGLNSSNALFIEETGTQHMGELVVALGDTDGDNRGEFAVGLASNASLRGTLMVYEGAAVGRQVERRLLYTSPLIAQLGKSIAGGVDVTGDGLADLIAGGWGSQSNGEAYVFPGDGNASYLSNQSMPAYVPAAPGEQAGTSVAVGQDFNGDGVRDLWVGGNGYRDHEGRVLIQLMGGSWGQPAGQLTVDTPGEHQNLGWSGTEVGDANNDGIVDVLFGAPSAHNGPVQAGKAWVCLGRERSFPENISLSIQGAQVWARGPLLAGSVTVTNLTSAIQAALDAANGTGPDRMVELTVAFEGAGAVNVSNVSVVYSRLRAPQGLSVASSPTGDKLTLTWLPQVTDGTQYSIWSNKSGGGFEVIATAPSWATTYEDHNVSDGVVFWYYVTDDDPAVGVRSPPSAPANGSPADVVPPAIPDCMNITLDAAGHKSLLQWVPNSDDTTFYEIWRRPGGTGPFTLRGTAVALATQYEDTGLLEDQNYSYLLRAIDDAGLSSEFDICGSISVPDLDAPAVSFYLPTAWPDNLPLHLSAENVTDDDARWGGGANGTFQWDIVGAPGSPIRVTGREVTVGPLDPGEYSVTLTAADAAGLSSNHTRFIQVQDRTPPLAVITGLREYNEGDTVTLDASETTDNVAGEPLAYHWSVTRVGLQQEDTGPNVTLANVSAGSYTIILDVIDGSDNRGSTVATFRVNDVPDVTTAPAKSYPTGQALTIPVVILDRDTTDKHTVTILSGPGGMAAANRQLTWTPANDRYGTYSVLLRVSDGKAEVMHQLFINVTRPAVAGNRAPEFTSTPPLGAVPGGVWQYTANASDLDHDLVTLVLVEGPQGMAWETAGAGLSLTWTAPGQGPERQTFHVVVAASDGLLRKEQAFDIRVRPANAAPVLAEAPFGQDDLTVQRGGVGRWSIVQNSVTDADDPWLNLTLFVVQGGGQWADVTVERNDVGVQQLVVSGKLVGNAELNLAVRDPSGESVSFTVPLHVEPALVQSGQDIPVGLLVMAVSGAGAAMFIGLALRRRRGAGAPMGPAAAAAAPGPPAALAVPTGPKYLVENVFLLYRDGRNMFWHVAGDQDKEDAESLGPMLVAIQDFVREALNKEADVRQLSYGENAIHIERTQRLVLGVTTFGEPPAALRDDMQRAAERVEAAFAGIIEDWDGNRSRLPGVEGMLEPLWAATASVAREDVLLATRPREVQVLSALEFFQGYLRLKVGVVNSTVSVVTDATLDLDFDTEVLHLERTEPEKVHREGAKVPLGVIHTGDRKTVAYYFDPLICTSSSIDGTVRYKDAEGVQHVTQMKNRRAEVVCPLFFTKEIASTALLKRLVETELQQYDVRSYAFEPSGVEGGTARDLFAAMKESVLAHDVRLVRERAAEGTATLEAWFYGETKVTGDKFVLRAMVDPSAGQAEFYAASTSMGKVTGMLAELNRTFTSTLERTAGAVPVKPVRDRSSRSAYSDFSSVWAMIERAGILGKP